MNPSLVEYRPDIMDELSHKPSFDDDQRSLEDLLKDPDFSSIDPDDLLTSSLFDDSGGNINNLIDKLDTIPSERNLDYDHDPTTFIKQDLPMVSPSSYRESTIDFDEDEIKAPSMDPISYGEIIEPDPLPPREPVNIDSNGFPVHGTPRFEERHRAYSSDADTFHDQSGYGRDGPISRGRIGRNGPPIQSSNTSMEMDHMNSNFHGIQLNSMEANTAPHPTKTYTRGPHTPPRTAPPQRHHSDPMVPPANGDIQSYNEAMEKLCESMKRSAMSRSLVKQLSGRNLTKQPSSRSLTKQGSQRSLNKQGSSRNLIKQGSQRSLLSDHSGHRSSPGYFPARRSSVDTKHRIGREVFQGRPMPGRGGLSRQNSSSAITGNNKRLGAMIQMDNGRGAYVNDGDRTVYSG